MAKRLTMHTYAVSCPLEHISLVLHAWNKTWAIRKARRILNYKPYDLPGYTSNYIARRID